MRWKIGIALIAWYASAALVYFLIPPSALKVATIDIAWLGPFAVYALWLARDMTRGDNEKARKIAPQRPLRREASSDAPTYPKLADRA